MGRSRILPSFDSLSKALLISGIEIRMFLDEARTNMTVLNICVRITLTAIESHRWIFYKPESQLQ